jgi:hypothetical protein
MSLLVSVPCAVVAAVAYGASTAVEHSVARASVQPGGGGLRSLVRNPRWLLGMAGDSLGLLFQILALATGPVVIVQPILVLALPVSLPIAWALGGPKPGATQYRFCLLILAGLTAFFVLIGNPGSGRPLTPTQAITATIIIVLAGLVALAAARRASSPVRAAVFGGVAGAWFGFVAVLLDAVSNSYSRHGIDAFGHPSGLLPLIILLVLGGVSIALTQVAFQSGSLSASFPANLVADPVVAVILGAALLYEDIPTSPLYIVGYLLCLAAVLIGVIRLAAEPSPAATGERSPRRTEPGS